MMDQAIVIFLEGKPKVSAVNWRGRFWHTAILYRGKVYETLADGKYRVTPLAYWPYRFEPLTTVKARIDPRKLKSELSSGTDCATYVARVIGLDTQTQGAQKNPNIYPEDIYQILLKKQSF